MAHTINGTGKVYEFNELLYDLSFLQKQIRFTVRITLQQNGRNFPPTPITQLYADRLTPKKSIKKPKGLEPRKLTVCYNIGDFEQDTNTVFIPYSANKIEHNEQIRQVKNVDYVNSVEYRSEKWINNLEDLL